MKTPSKVIEASEMDSLQQDELDSLVIQKLALPDSGNDYVPLYRTLGKSHELLPSHFAYQVMQRILRIKLDRARATASLQSVLIGVLVLAGSAALIQLYDLYSGGAVLPISFFSAGTGALMLPAVASLVLFVLVLLDRILSAPKQP